MRPRHPYFEELPKQSQCTMDVKNKCYSRINSFHRTCVLFSWFSPELALWLEWIIAFSLSLISLPAGWDDLQGLTSSCHGSLTLFLDSVSSARLPEYKLWYFDCCSIYFIQTHGDSQIDLCCGWKLTFSRKRLGQRKFFKGLCNEIK